MTSDVTDGRLAGRIALVTGAASGIGLVRACRFAAEGATVIATDVDATAGAAVEEERIRFRLLDVADSTAWSTVADEIASEHGRLDLVHLNAGIRIGVGEIGALTDDDYLRVIGVNQHGVVFGLRATLPLLEAADGSAVVVTASRALLGPLPNDLAYVMSKHAVNGLVRSVAEDLAARGITINVICPATVDTGFLAGAGREQLEAAGIEVMDSYEVADGVMEVLGSSETGQCFVQLPGGRPTTFEFPPVPGR